MVLLGMGQLLTLVHWRPLSDSWYLVCWLGFIAFFDAVVGWRTGASLLGDRPREAIAMFVSSAALWWCFELANAMHLASWAYSPSPDIPRWAQAARSTLAFATLIPATWTAGLVALTFLGVEKMDSRGDDERSTRRWAFLAITAGAMSVVLALACRRFALPLALSGTLLIVDAVNHLRGRPSLLVMFARRQWRAPTALFAGNVAAGLLGEAWNYPADPRWTYEVGFSAGPKLFAMPVAGYLGYGVLAWALFALYHAVRPRTLSHRDSSLVAPSHPLAVTGL
jgi:hypothetical protein